MKKKSLSTYLLNLLLLGFLAKGVSLVSRIIMTRTLGIDAMAIFSLVNPLIVLIITLSSFSLPTILATLLSKRPEDSKRIFITSVWISAAISLALVLALVFSADTIARDLLHNIDTKPSIYITCILIPLVSLSSLIKGYFLGNKEVMLTSFSQVFEEGSRLFFVSFFLSYFLVLPTSSQATVGVLAMAVGEVAQITYMLVDAKKTYKKRYKKLFLGAWKKENLMVKEMLSLSFPLTLSRLVGSLTYFIEPIIVTSLLIQTGWTSDDVTRSYGILASYVMPLLLMPGFFSLALSNYLLPNMTSLIAKKEYQRAKSLFYRITLACTLIGTLVSCTFFFFGDKILLLLYHTQEGKELIRLLAFPFLIYYIETPLAQAMHALNMTLKAFRATVFSCILRILLLLVLTKFLGTVAVALATLASVYLDVLLNFIDIRLTFLRYEKNPLLEHKS